MIVYIFLSNLFLLFSGIAYLHGMCTMTGSCTLAEARSLGSAALIIAHELVHNLGVSHDGVLENSDCDGNDYIMGPLLSKGAVAWSACTRFNKLN